ncbi:hypothetical protein GGX14DRAFT_454422 [Mycena pura]|uniref:Uncharacterized protein n=1 Tax=Mycena pura TaxID=153505 RepID=A0AAD6VCP1_9AGAR|nr:hypothetical protein GGX14DRAFT_454412 [Mycena pura]KAJ7208350.1 hypothetical protein GGX14DRAFT_454422 [Mycena pura]
MLRDGAMYFGAIVIANLANIFTFYFGDVLLSGLISWFTTSLSVTLLSRLMLNIHETGSAGIDSTMADTPELETLRFSMSGRTVGGGEESHGRDL